MKLSLSEQRGRVSRSEPGGSRDVSRRLDGGWAGRQASRRRVGTSDRCEGARGGGEVRRRAHRSRSLSGRRGNGADSSHARLYSACRTGFAGRRRGQSLGRGRRAVLAAGRSERRPPAGAGREAARPAGAFSHAVAVSIAVSVAAAGRGSWAVPSASCSSTSSTSSTSSPASAASSALRERGTCHEGDDCQAEHERAKSGHVSRPPLRALNNPPDTGAASAMPPSRDCREANDDNNLRCGGVMSVSPRQQALCSMCKSFTIALGA
jgi:hypothetical protein